LIKGKSKVEWLIRKYLAFYHHHPVLAVMLVVVTVIVVHDFVITSAIKKVFGRVYRFRIGKTLVWIVSLVLVVVTYFTVVAVTAIYMKLLGRHLLPEGMRPAARTYWSDREKVNPTLDYLKRQF
jgi:uncharacterized membrane protein